MLNTPNMDVVETRPRDLPDYLDLCAEIGVAAFMIGTHGVGKTSILYDWATAHNRKLCDRVVSIMDPTADFAMGALDRDGSLDFRHNRSFPFVGFEPEWVNDSNPPVVFFDEFNQATTTNQNMAMKIIQERHLHGRPLIPGTAIFLAGNRLSDQAFVNKVSGPMANRVMWLYLTLSLEDTLDWGISTGRLDDFVMAYLKLNPDHLHISTMRQEDIDGQTKVLASYESAHPSPRAWENVSKVLRTNPSEPVRLAAVSGLVGLAVATNFEQTYRLRNDMPDLDDICLRGHAKIPSDVATRFVLLNACMRRVDKTNLGNIFKYFGNFDVEVQVMLAKLIAKHKEGLKSHTAFTQWAIKNAHHLS